MVRTIFASLFCTALLLPRAALAEDSVPLNESLVSAKLPDGFEAKDQYIDAPGVPFKLKITVVACSKPLPRATIESAPEDHPPSTKSRRDFVRGFLHATTADDGTAAKQGLRVVSKVVPDLETETFEKHVPIVIVYVNPKGAKILTYHEVFFADNSYVVSVTGVKGDEFNQLKKWATTVKPKQ